MKKDYTNVWRLIDRIDDNVQMQMAIDDFRNIRDEIEIKVKELLLKLK